MLILSKDKIWTILRLIILLFLFYFCLLNLRFSWSSWVIKQNLHLSIIFFCWCRWYCSSIWSMFTWLSFYTDAYHWTEGLGKGKQVRICLFLSIIWVWFFDGGLISTDWSQRLFSIPFSCWCYTSLQIFPEYVMDQLSCWAFFSKGFYGNCIYICIHIHTYRW